MAKIDKYTVQGGICGGLGISAALVTMKVANAFLNLAENKNTNEKQRSIFAICGLIGLGLASGVAVAKSTAKAFEFTDDVMAAAKDGAKQAVIDKVDKVISNMTDEDSEVVDAEIAGDNNPDLFSFVFDEVDLSTGKRLKNVTFETLDLIMNADENIRINRLVASNKGSFPVKEFDNLDWDREALKENTEYLM